MRKHATVKAGLLVLALSLARSSSAQSAIDGPADATLVAAAQQAGLAVKRQAQRDPRVRSSLALPEPQLTLETTKDKQKATASVGLVRHGASGETTFGLAVSSPIGDAPDAESSPIDLRGLTDGAMVSFNVSGSSLFKTFSVKDMVMVCSERQIAKEDCTAGKLQAAGDQKTADALLDLAFKDLPLLYGASLSYGRNQFSFFDVAGTKQDPIRRNDLEAQVSLGFLVNERRDLLAVHLAYSNIFKASSNKTQLCRPLTNSNVTRCDAATIGGPNNPRSLIGTVEYRLQKRGDSRLPLAFAPRLQFAAGLDDADDVVSIEAPLYFFQDKPKDATAPPKLNGGISAGWRSDIGFQAGVFIGATFSLFKL